MGTDRGSVKARNLAARPAMVARLESGEETVVLVSAVNSTVRPPARNALSAAISVAPEGVIL